MASDPVHERLLAIVKKLPEAVEDWPWGSIHCKVAGKIFVGWSRDADGVMSVGLRTTPELQATLVSSDPRFSIAKYTGKYGGIDLRLGARPNWAEVEQLIVESYRIVAPKRLARLLERAPTRKAPAKKQASQRKARKH
ncbi:MAG: MmcQ/YjbR family DNA-binding protein [Polyangiaceae bacterium]